MPAKRTPLSKAPESFSGDGGASRTVVRPTAEVLSSSPDDSTTSALTPPNSKGASVVLAVLPGGEDISDVGLTATPKSPEIVPPDAAPAPTTPGRPRPRRRPAPAGPNSSGASDGASIDDAPKDPTPLSAATRIMGSQLFSPGKPLFIVALVVGVLAVTAVVIFFVSRVGIITYDEPLYRYENGVRIDYEGATQIRHEEDVFFVKNSGVEQELPHAPIYFTNDENRVYIPNQMIYVDPSGARPPQRTGFNTELLREPGATPGSTTVIATVNGDPVTLTDGFLFDGHNTYLFLEPMTLVWGDNKLEVPVYSFAVVYYNLRFEIYPLFDEGNITVEQSGDDIIRAVADSGAYTIDMSKDILQTKEGELLLFTEPSLLEFVE